MKRLGKRITYAVLMIATAALACSLPSGVTNQPVLSSDQIAASAVAAAFTAQAAANPRPTEAVPAPATATPSPIPSQCAPMVTASTDANVRGGPDTAYGVLGYIPAGGSAPVAGRNDANTWWYIQFPGGYGGYGWISSTVVVPSCIPSVVQVVAAPPLPTAVPPTATLKILLIPPLLFYKSPTPTPIKLFLPVYPIFTISP